MDAFDDSDSADALDDSDSADALLPIRRYRGLMIPRTPFDDSADILDNAAEKLRITDAVNPRIS